MLRYLPKPWPERVGVGISGGGDSVFLLLMLAELHAAGHAPQPLAWHVNHGLRGAESDGDEEFVRALARRLGVPFATQRLSFQPRLAPVSEESMRSARHDALAEMAKEQGTAFLALAHHADDQAETVLMRLFRGTGLRGLAGMSPLTPLVSVSLCRPLLDFSRAEIRSLLTAEGEPWREDASNAATDKLRNMLRQEVIPRLEETVAPGLRTKLAALAADAALWRLGEDRWLDDYLTTEPGWPQALRVASLRELPAPRRHALIRSWLEANSPQGDGGETVSRVHVERLTRFAEAAHEGQTRPLPSHAQAVVTSGWLRYRPSR